MQQKRTQCIVGAALCLAANGLTQQLFLKLVWRVVHGPRRGGDLRQYPCTWTLHNIRESCSLLVNLCRDLAPFRASRSKPGWIDVKHLRSCEAAPINESGDSQTRRGRRRGNNVHDGVKSSIGSVMLLLKEKQLSLKSHSTWLPRWWR